MAETMTFEQFIHTTDNMTEEDVMDILDIMDKLDDERNLAINLIEAELDIAAIQYKSRRQYYPAL